MPHAQPSTAGGVSLQIDPPLTSSRSRPSQEILWLAEAAHAPVVWATQVLESMCRTGVPSRAEVTDAANAARAEAARCGRLVLSGRA